MRKYYFIGFNESDNQTPNRYDISLMNRCKYEFC